LEMTSVSFPRQGKILLGQNRNSVAESSDGKLIGHKNVRRLKQ
jgi:hypothetical protein